MSRKHKQDRCDSASPGLGWRCEKKLQHIGKHRAAYLSWGQGEGTTWTGPQAMQGHTSSVPLLDEATSFFEFLPPPAVPVAEQVLRDWWLDKAKSETDMVVDKAIEYGATDLIDIGLMLARTMGRVVNEAEAAELGVFFYLIGKVSRWQSAIERGKPVSDDTLLDIGVYIRMAQRIRESGGWPGVEMPNSH